jgi:uncharacterized protein (TIGR03086 family)
MSAGGAFGVGVQDCGMDIRDLDRRAVEESVRLVELLTPDQLDSPSPCAEWNVRQLLEHSIAQHHGFAKAAEGVDQDRAEWLPQPLPADFVAAYRDSADHVINAFAPDDVLDRTFLLAEIEPAFRFPAAQAIGFHTVDYVVHSWDIARSVGAQLKLDDDLLAVGLQIAERVPEGERRLQPGAAFRPGLPSNDDATSLDRTLALLGRSPSWPN